MTGRRPAGATIICVAPGDPLAGVDALVLCFDSLTSLLRHVSQKRAFRFLHAISRRVARTSAVGHYHADREAHDEEKLATFAPLFDATVEIGPGEKVEIRR